MLTVVHRPFLKAAVAFYSFYLNSPFAAAANVVAEKAMTMTTLEQQQQQHMRRQQEVDADFGGSPASSPVARPTGSDSYDIVLATSNDKGWTVSADVQSFFDAASQKWPTIITGDLTDVSTGALAGTDTSSLQGQFGTCPYPETIDDLWICASAGNLGGVVNGKITLAYATVLDVRQVANGLPFTGVIAFNNQARGVIADALLESVTIHEIGHVLGIGTLWVQRGLATSRTRPCTYTSTSKASNEYRSISGCSNAVSLEVSTGSSGSDCVHWDESCFVNELMTPTINSGTTNPISKVTIGTLDDLGYIVNYSAADSYTTFRSSCTCSRDPASPDETTTMTTTDQVDETRHNKPSLNDPNHPDAQAIAKAKEVLASMIAEAPGPDDVPPVGGNMTQDPWVSIVTYDTNTGTAHSYIITASDVGLLL